MIQEYFTIGQEVTLLDGSYDFGLVALSLMIAIFASFMAFNVATQAAVSTNKFRKYTLLSAGSIAMGGGIWAMHFWVCSPLSCAPPFPMT